MAATTSTTALAVSAPSVVTGDEQDEQLTVTVSGAGDTPTGTVTVAAGATTVCTITLANGTGSCAPTSDEFPVGTVMLTASYSGDDTFESSASPTASFEVTSPPPPAAAPTATTLKLSKAAVTYGDEQAEEVSVLVGTPDAIAVGKVTVDSGSTTVCQFSLSSLSSGSCTLAAAALPPGPAQLTASYAGSTELGFAPSVSSAEPLTVAKEPTTTAVSLSAAKVTYGAEQRERISVAVKPAFGVPAGRVTVKAGSAVICVVTLRSDRKSVV